MQVTVTEVKKGTRILTIKPIYWDLVCHLTSDSAVSIMSSVTKIDVLESQLWSYAGRVINAEISGLCSKANPSILRKTDKESLQKFAWSSVEKEFETRAPHFLKTLKNAACDPVRMFEYKKKTVDTVLPAILSAGCKLIGVRSREMNAFRRLTSVLLKKGGLKKYMFKILTNTCDCVSYSLTISMLDDFGSNFDVKLLCWQKEVTDGINREKVIKNQLARLTDSPNPNCRLFSSTLQHDLKLHVKWMHPGYCFVSDNVDIQIKVRHMTRERQHKDYHLFNMLAYKNRVGGNELSDEKPIASIKDIPLAEFLPNDEDNRHYLEEFTHLIALIWCQHIPALSWWKEHLPTYIPHEHEQEMKKKSERVI